VPAQCPNLGEKIKPLNLLRIAKTMELECARQSFSDQINGLNFLEAFIGCLLGEFSSILEIRADSPMISTPE
jgi:hypothetical protein